jgi:hypothetical protein
MGFHHLDFCLRADLIKLQKALSVIVPALRVLGTLGFLREVVFLGIFRIKFYKYTVELF